MARMAFTTLWVKAGLLNLVVIVEQGRKREENGDRDTTRRAFLSKCDAKLIG